MENKLILTIPTETLHFADVEFETSEVSKFTEKRPGKMKALRPVKLLTMRLFLCLKIRFCMLQKNEFN